MMDLLESIDYPLLLILLTVFCIPLYATWAAFLFGSWQKAILAVRWVFIRDSKSFMEGDYIEDKFAEVRLAALLIACLMTIAAFYKAVTEMIQWLSS